MATPTPIHSCYVVYSKYFLGDDEPMIAVADSMDRVQEIDMRMSSLHPGIEIFWQRTPWNRRSTSPQGGETTVHVVSNGPLMSPVAVEVFDDGDRATEFAAAADLRLRGHHVCAMRLNYVYEQFEDLDFYWPPGMRSDN